PALTVALVVLIELLAPTPLRLSNPPALLMLAIVFSAFSGGLGPGLASAVVACTYTAYFFSQPGQPFPFDEENLRRVALWGLTMPLTAFLVGHLNRRAAQALAETEVAERKLAEHQARRQMRMNDAMFSQAITCFVLLDREFRFIRVNEAFARHYGK